MKENLVIRVRLTTELSFIPAGTRKTSFLQWNDTVHIKPLQGRSRVQEGLTNIQWTPQFCFVFLPVPVLLFVYSLLFSFWVHFLILGVSFLFLRRNLNLGE